MIELPFIGHWKWGGEGNRREAESTHLPRFWHSPASLSWQIWQTVTVVPRFNEVPRDWRNLFAILRVRYIEHLHLSNFRAENYQNNRYIEIKLIVYLQNPAFLDLKNYWLISFHYRAIHSYGTKNSRTGKQNCLKLSTHKFHPCWSVWHSSLITCWHLFVISRNLFTFALGYCVRHNEDLLKSRFCSIHFTVTLAGLMKIVPYTEDLVI